jgi:phage host-nuclease inhibitor protein Gam
MADLTAERVLCESYLIDKNQITEAYAYQLDITESLKAEISALERKLKGLCK